MQSARNDFPLLKQKINGKRVVYLDSAAMALKPQSVISAVGKYYKEYTANVFRGVYRLSEKATQEYEETRKKIARFINAKSEKEVIYVRNATEAINLIAYAWGRLNINREDEIVTTIMEHHSNFVPWQQLCIENGATLKVVDIDNNGKLEMANCKLENIVSKKTKLLTITYVSNALGTINPVKKITTAAKKINPKIVVLVDAAQAVPHLKVDVTDLGCDFLTFSGQKMLGPTGAGALWGKMEILESMFPFMLGGEMIRTVSLDKTTFMPPPHKFEAGTPHIAGVIGLGAAVDYLSNYGIDKVQAHERKLTRYALKKLAEIKGLTIYGPKDSKVRSGAIIFNIKDVHAHDVAQILDEDNIYVRAGHHCTMPLHDRLGIPASVRATFYIYNTKEDIDMLVKGTHRVKKIFNL